VRVHEVIVAADGSKAWALLTQSCELMLHLPLSFDLTMQVLVYLKDTPRGKVIVAQRDYHSFESILVSTPILGWFIENLFQRAVTLQIVGGATVAGALWPRAERPLRAAGLGRALGAAQAALADWWWREIKGFRGRPLPPPYDPFL
jgi:hypothetical protein